MKKQEYLIPGIALVLAIILGVYLVASNRGGETDSATSDTATSTIATTTDSTVGQPANTGRRPLAQGPHYAYGPVTLSLNQVAGFASGLSIRPISVVEDSRCPINARCIQAGTVKLLVRSTMNTFTENAQTELMTLTLGEAKTVGSNVITLENVTPAPETGTTFESNEYRFTLRVTSSTNTGGDSNGGAGTGQCYVGGCSSQLCTDNPDAVSTCEYRAEYACYRSAKCERQSNGMCGWTPSKELTRCLANPPALR